MSVRIVLNKVVSLSPNHAPVTIGSPDQRKFSESRVRESMLHLLQENTLCSLATVRRNNHAHISPVYFCYSDDLKLYFLSDPRSLHCQNLLANASMAVTIFDSSQKWGQADRGMELFGTCREVRGEYATQAELLYGKRFPAFAQWKTAHSEDVSFQYRFYRFAPREIKILDESQFGGGIFVSAALKFRTPNRSKTDPRPTGA
jgi:uncharacterized protein YhbP (UPF0306 family)